MANIQAFIDNQFLSIQSNANYQKIKAMPPTQRWATLGGLFIISQLTIIKSVEEIDQLNSQVAKLRYKISFQDNEIEKNETNQIQLNKVVTV